MRCGCGLMRKARGSGLRANRVEQTEIDKIIDFCLCCIWCRGVALFFFGKEVWYEKREGRMLRGSGYVLDLLRFGWVRT